jgi:hypothetical protein
VFTVELQQPQIAPAIGKNKPNSCQQKPLSFPDGMSPCHLALPALLASITCAVFHWKRNLSGKEEEA